MRKQESDNKKTTIYVDSETRNKLMQIKFVYNFSSIDALIRVLLKNSDILNKIIKKELED